MTPGLNFVADLEREADLAPIVEQAHGVALREATLFSVLRVEDAERLAFTAAQEPYAREGGVSLEVARRRQQPERPFLGFECFDRIFDPIRQWRQALLVELRRIEFELARGRGEFLADTGMGDVDRLRSKELRTIALPAGPVAPLSNSPASCCGVCLNTGSVRPMR